MKRGLGLVLLSSTFIISCAQVAPRTDVTLPQAGSPLSPQTAALPAPQESVVGHLAESQAIPLDINQFVDRWLVYFQGKGRRHMERYLARSNRYVGLMKQILKDNGVPEELVYVAMIESGFSFQARSHAKAVGYWQFIGGTARRYGLRMNKFVDERRDPIASTEAAAQYLRGLYNLFGQWELALAAYNVGENRVQRVITESYTRDYWEMARRRMLPDETLNYVPKFIAASLIAMNPEKYGFKDIDYYPPFEFETVTFTKPVNLRTMAAHLNLKYADFKMMNPSYRTDHAALNSGGECVLRVPRGMSEVAKESAGKFTVSGGRFVATLDQTERDYFYYRIKRGENLAKIADRHGVSQSAIRQLNGLRNGTKIRAGMKIKIPGNASVDASQAKERTPVAAPAKRSALNRYVASRTRAKQRVHIVRSGETLANIARVYKVELRTLAKANQISRGAKLFIGAKLVIPD